MAEGSSQAKLRMGVLGLVLLLAVFTELSRERDAVLPGLYGVALHVHGPLSEGFASMASQDAAADRLGDAVDVIWWTDHSWRIQGHTVFERFDFESGFESYDRVPRPPRLAEVERIEQGPSPSTRRGVLERLGIDQEERSLARWRQKRTGRKPELARVEISEDRAWRSKRSLRLDAASSSPGWQSVAVGLETERRRHVTPLAAGVRLQFFVLADSVEGEARLVLSAGLSQRPDGTRGLLEWVMPLNPARNTSPMDVVEQVIESGNRLTRRVELPLPIETGRWTPVVVDVSEAAHEYGLGGDDNALSDLSLRLEVNGTSRAVVYVDDFEILRAQMGNPLVVWQQDQAAAMTDESRIHHVGQEISYAAHLNAYGTSVPLLKLRDHPNGMVPSEAVEWVHHHRGIVSFNHPFGIETALTRSTTAKSLARLDERMDKVTAKRLYGADLLEVGYRARGRDLDSHLALWDRLSAAGVPVTGVGANDSHDANEGWVRGPNNFITWVYAQSRSQKHLIEGLRAGRAFFGDPTRFGGRIELAVVGRGDMGVVLTRGREPDVVEARISGLRAGQFVVWVENGESVPAEMGDEPPWRGELRVTAPGPAFVRIEVHDAEGPVALSNPVYFVDEEATQISASRRPSNRESSPYEWAVAR